ncbi:hypothetical protein BsWGS_25250 [Bradybaena similaris]
MHRRQCCCLWTVDKPTLPLTVDNVTIFRTADEPTLPWTDDSVFWRLNKPTLPQTDDSVYWRLNKPNLPQTGDNVVVFGTSEKQETRYVTIRIFYSKWAQRCSHKRRSRSLKPCTRYRLFMTL